MKYEYIHCIHIKTYKLILSFFPHGGKKKKGMRLCMFFYAKSIKKDKAGKSSVAAFHAKLFVYIIDINKEFQLVKAAKLKG